MAMRSHQRKANPNSKEQRARTPARREKDLLGKNEEAPVASSPLLSGETKLAAIISSHCEKRRLNRFHHFVCRPQAHVSTKKNEHRCAQQIRKA